jgi:hypothetical protein
MGFLGKLIKGTINTALIPVDVAKDVVTLGGTLDDEEETYTGKRVKQVIKDVEEAAEDAGEGDLL